MGYLNVFKCNKLTSFVCSFNKIYRREFARNPYVICRYACAGMTFVTKMTFQLNYSVSNKFINLLKHTKNGYLFGIVHFGWCCVKQIRYIALNYYRFNARCIIRWWLWWTDIVNSSFFLGETNQNWLQKQIGANILLKTMTPAYWTKGKN